MFLTLLDGGQITGNLVSGSVYEIALKKLLMVTWS